MKRRDRQRRSGQAASSASTEGQTSRPSGKRAGFIDSVRRWIVPRADRSAVRSLWLWCLSGLLATGLVVAALVVGVAAFRSPVVVPGADLQFDDPAVSAAHEAACDQVRQHPRSAAAWAHLGLLLAAHDHSQPATTCLAQGRIPEATAVFRGILALEPAYAPAWTDLADCLRETDPDTAQQAAANAARYGRSRRPATISP
jgi:hypothetical protein